MSIDQQTALLFSIWSAKICWHPGLEMSLVSHCMPGLLPEPMNELSWNAGAVTSQDRRCPPNAYH